MKCLSPLTMLTVSCAAPFLAAGQSPTNDLEQTLTALCARHEIVGLSAAALRDGVVIWSAQRGLADRARQVPVRAETKFRVASISKTITAAALMQFWEQGRFRLDDDISPHLGYRVAHPRFPETPITFRHLLTHTAGFRDGAAYDAFLMHTYHHATNAPSLRELLCPGGEFYRDGAVFGTNAPGARYAYSNLGFGLLGTLVERFADERFDRYCARRLFEPLGMSARFNPADLGAATPLAVLYQFQGGGWTARCDDYQGAAPPDRLGENYPIGRNALPCAPQGGLRASSEDLARFLRAFRDPAHAEERGILRAGTVEVMLGRAAADGGPAATLGFQRSERLLPGEVWIGHSGSAYGLKSMMYWEAGGPLGVILLTSGSQPDTRQDDATTMEREVFTAIVRHLRAGP